MKNIFLNFNGFTELEIPYYKDSLDNSKMVLSGERGLLTGHSINKPIFYAYDFLAKMGSDFLYQDQSCLITSDKNRDYSIVCHNAEIADNDLREVSYSNYKNIFLKEKVKKVIFNFRNLNTGNYKLKIRRVNYKNGNMVDLWEDLDYISRPTVSEFTYIRNKSLPKIKIKDFEVLDGNYNLSLDLASNEFVYIHLIYKY